MKNLQKFICLLALLVGINSLSAQNNTITLVAKSPLGDDFLHIAYESDENHSLCDATFSIKYMFEDDYVPLTMESCHDRQDDINSCTIKVADPEGNSHWIVYSTEIGLVMNAETGGEDHYFGIQYMMKDYTSNKNIVYLFIGGENTRLSFTVPKLGLDDDVFVFRNKYDAENFMKQFMAGVVEEIVFTLAPALSINDEYAKCKLKKDKNNKLLMQIEYQNNKVAFTVNPPE